MRSHAPHPRARIATLVAGAILSIAAAVAIFYWGSCARVAEPYITRQRDTSAVNGGVAQAPTQATKDPAR